MDSLKPRDPLGDIGAPGWLFVFHGAAIRNLDGIYWVSWASGLVRLYQGIITTIFDSPDDLLSSTHPNYNAGSNNDSEKDNS